MPIDRRTLLTGALANTSGIAVPLSAHGLGARRARAGARSRLLLTSRPSWFAASMQTAALSGPELDGGDHPLPEAVHCAHRRQPIG